MATASSVGSTPDISDRNAEIPEPEENVLCSELWERLPDALIEEILAKLPFSSLGDFCCVCKRWRNAILSNQALVLSFTAGQLAVHNSGRGMWESVPLPFLRSLDLVASAGGLLCFCPTASVGEFILCNPLTKRCKRLQMPCGQTPKNDQQPFMRTPSRAWLKSTRTSQNLIVGMVQNSDARFFKLIVAAIFPSLPRTTLVYDSRSKSWEKGADVPEGFFFHIKSLACNGNLFFFSAFGLSIRPYGKLLNYNVDLHTWSVIRIPQQAGFTRKLIEHNGKVLLLTEKDRNSRKFMEHNGKVMLLIEKTRFSDNFMFFELQGAEFTSLLSKDSLSLTRIMETMSLRILDDVAAGEVSIECLGQGDVICVVGKSYTSGSGVSGLRCKKFSLRVGIHNFSTNSEVLSEWERWRPSISPPVGSCQIFRPGMLPFN